MVLIPVIGQIVGFLYIFRQKFWITQHHLNKNKEKAEKIQEINTYHMLFSTSYYAIQTASQDIVLRQDFMFGPVHRTFLQ